MDGRRGIQAYLFDRAALLIEALLRFAVIERVHSDQQARTLVAFLSFQSVLFRRRTREPENT